MRLNEMILGLKEIIEPKLIYSPFLRLIIFNVWFQLGFAAVMLTLISAGLYLPKMWRTSPPGFEPVIHVSGLDMTQAWALKRSARKYQDAGDYVKAAEAFQGAVAENPSDLNSLHAFLENSLRLKPSEKRFVLPVMTQMQWLLRINKTNQTDLELMGRVCDHFGWYDLPAYFLGARAGADLPEATEATVIKGLFHQNRMAEFRERLAKQGARLKDPELDLYQLAYDAGWTEGTNAVAALAELKRASEAGENSERVGHLLLRAAAQKNDLPLYLEELNRLGTRNEASAADHALYWSLLASRGQTNEAVKLAESFTGVPNSTFELLRLAQSYVALGLWDNARDLLKKAGPQFGRSPEVWVLYEGILEVKQDWDEMRAAARLLRQDGSVREILWGLSYFMEGRADLAQQRAAGAAQAFDRAAESAYDYDMVGAVVARELTRLNFPKQALRVYAAIEAKQEKNRDYWAGVFAAAYAAQDAAVLLKATERSYRFNPADVGAVNRYAAALLLNRIRPEEAIQLTLQLYAKYPDSPTAMINHSCSLLLNHRAEEARALLEGIDRQRLSTTELSPYYLALFETYHALKDWDRAWKARDNLMDGALFPIQREWLRRKEKDMPSRIAGKV